MLKKKFCQILLCTGLFASCLEVNAYEQSKESSHIALLTTHLLMSRHYVKREITAGNSKKLFNNYLKALDPQHIFFTQGQVDSWNKQAPLILSQLAGSGNCTFAYYVYAQYLKRLKEYEAFAKSLKISESDLNSKKEFLIDRTKSPWPADTAAMKELWHNKIINDMILLRILDKIEKEEKKEGTDDSAWRKKDPLDRIRQRITQFVKMNEKLDQLEILELYLNALSAVYDPHTTYMAPKNEEDFNINMRLSLVGIGAVLTTSDEGYTKIVEIIPGGPADKDGRLKANDRIIAVQQKNGPPVEIMDIPLSKVVSMIRGNVGTDVTLTVIDGTKGPSSAPKKITLTRQKVELKESEAKGTVRTVNGEKIGIITLPSFYIDFAAAYKGDKNYKSSTKDVKKILEDFRKQGVKGVIIDLRANGGGALPEAISLTGLFIKSGPVVQIRDAAGNTEVANDDDNNYIAYSGPLIVMTNRLSASASEIFAGAIRDHERGIIVGDAKTHGKGTVQTVEELDRLFSYFKDGFKAGLLKYTNAKFYRVNGESTQLRGVVPDIIYPSFTDAMELGEEKLESPMKWDTVAPASGYTPYDKTLAEKISRLREKSEKRIRNNAEFKLLKKDIVRYSESQKKKTVVLNLKQRWKEYQDEKKIYDQQKKLLNLDSSRSGKKKDKKQSKDIYLDEASAIMADLIKMK